jgi:DNA-binding CsgD family transcriptional regulator
MSVRRHDLRLPLDVLAGALVLIVWVAAGSLVLAIASGLGSHPVRRVVIGLLLLSASACMLWQRDRLASVLRTRPWLVLVLAATELGVASIDGVYGGPYVAFSLSAVGIATIVARARTVWLCVALLEIEYAAIVFSGSSPASAGDGRLADVLGTMLSYPVTALVFMSFRARFTNFVAAADAALAQIRGGTTAFTPALGHVINNEPLQLPASRASLTPTERKVVEGLAAGVAAKQIAAAWGISQDTVRSHIKNAKRKTGSRTLRELAALSSRADWHAR